MILPPKRARGVTLLCETSLTQWRVEGGNFMEFIYFSSFMISVNFPDQLVTDI